MQLESEAALLAMIERHLARTGETESAFGTRLARDGNLVSDLRKGRSPRLRLAFKIMRETQKSADGGEEE